MIKRIIKIMAWGLVIFFVVINILFYTFTLQLGNTTTNDKINYVYIENKKHFNDLAQIFFQNDIDDISVNNTNFKDELYRYGEECVITAEFLFDHIDNMHIKKDDDCLYVILGSAKDFEQGIVYLNNRQIPSVKDVDRINFSILESNWYYYEIVE